jgi:ketosteroid isomerase-like protein
MATAYPRGNTEGMSEDAVGRVREFLEALADGGVDAVLPYLHSDFELVVSAETALEPGSYRGGEGLRRYFGSYDEAMGDVHSIPQHLEGSGERVLADMILRARGSGSGIEVELRGWVVFTLRDAKILRIEDFPDRDSAAAAAGLS